MEEVISTLTPTSPPTPPLKERRVSGGGSVVVVEDRLDGQCVRHVHLMSNEAIGREALRAYGILPTTALIEVGQSAGSHFLRASGAFRGVWEVNAACREGKFRRLVVWNLEGCASVKAALYEAAQEFERLFAGRAQFGFMNRLPKGAEHGMDVGDLTLFESEWMLERAVAVGGRR